MIEIQTTAMRILKPVKQDNEMLHRDRTSSDTMAVQF